MNYRMQDPPEPLDDRLLWYADRLEKLDPRYFSHLDEFRLAAALFIVEHRQRLSDALSEAYQQVPTALTAERVTL